MLFGALRTAMTALGVNKMRSVLSVLGIVIGVSAVTVMIAMGRSVQDQISGSIGRLGVNAVFVYPKIRKSAGGVARNVESQRLTLGDALALQELPHVAEVAPEFSRSYQVKAGRNNTSCEVIATWPEYRTVRNLKVAEGRFLSRSDDDASRRVCVLGSQVAEDLFGVRPPLDAWVRINRHAFRVVGVLLEKGGRNDTDRKVFVPFRTSAFHLAGVSYLRMINVSIDEPANVNTAIALMDATMRRRHRIPPGEEPDVGFIAMNEILEEVGNITGAFTLLLSGIAALSLLVGGIGIMNIMLVSVTERTREIGIRKAVGARRSDVVTQFLVESVTVSFLGGLLGVVVGGFGTKLLAMLPFWEGMTGEPMRAVIPMDAVAVAFGFSCAIGIFFGMYPAVKASRMSPVEALRHE